MQARTSPEIPSASLESLRALALDAGATDAVVIPAKDVLFDPRVRFKCMVPKCYMSGACAHCPPLGFTMQEVRDSVLSHGYAVFFKVEVPARVIAATGLAGYINTGNLDPEGCVLALGAYYLLVFSIVKRLQKKAGEMGLSSRAGFAAGNCRDALCHFQPLCGEIAGTGCRHPDLSSPSMESCGMDAFSMAARMGWEVFPIGGTCRPESVGHGTLMGLAPVGGRDAAPPAVLPRPQKPDLGLGQAKKSLAASRQAGFNLGILLRQGRDARTWGRFLANLADLTGSWTAAGAKLAHLFSGRPRKTS
ncbi:MAG: hypothetical protein JRI97_02700 [Deltaproteobacteria bacterium]|nr:hypothetical protein [Deltaproteobacteria bacterium]